MKALTFSSFGGPEVMEYREVPDPQAATGVAVVRTRAIGLNFADIYRRQGRYHLKGTPPYIAGYEAAGVIAHIEPADAKASGLKIGDRVAFADSPFSNAELVAVPLEHLLPLPEGVSDEQAAAVLLQGLTAQYLVEDSYAVRAGDKVLVHAAAGGVGLLLTQLAKARGAQVMALASTADKRAAAEQAGADVVIASGPGWLERLKAAVKGGMQVVYDSVGTTLLDSLAAARKGGTVVFYGMADGAPPAVDPRILMDRSLHLVGGDLWNVLRTAADRRERSARLFAAMQTGQLNVRVAERFALKDGARAHAFLEGRQAIGKVLLIP
jgi:NADPH2:quinone reductase